MTFYEFTLTRPVILQVAMEIRDNVNTKPVAGVDGLCILSSYEATVFFVLKQGVLYVSQEYGPENQPILAMYAFLCAATNTFPGMEFNLPKPDLSWCTKGKYEKMYQRARKSTRGGIPEWYAYLYK